METRHLLYRKIWENQVKMEENELEEVPEKATNEPAENNLKKTI